MKYLLASAALLGPGLAPVAQAQATCTEINAVLGYGLDDFDDILAERLDEDIFEASYWMTDAEECNVEYDFDSIYSCVWVFDSQAAAAAAYASQASVLGSCLAGWARETKGESSEAAGSLRTLRSDVFEGSGKYVDMEWNAVLEEHVLEDSRDWHVWLGLIYLW